MSFDSWLHKPEPEWKEKLELCDNHVFEELELDKDKIHSILEKLTEHNIVG